MRSITRRQKARFLATLSAAAVFAGFVATGTPAEAAPGHCSELFKSPSTLPNVMSTWMNKVGLRPLKESNYASYMSILGNQREVFGSKVGIQLFSMYPDGDLQSVFADLEGQLFPTHLGAKSFSVRKTIELDDSIVRADDLQRAARRIGVARITMGPAPNSSGKSRIVLESMSEIPLGAFTRILKAPPSGPVDAINELMNVQEKSLSLEHPRNVSGRILDLNADDRNHDQVLWFSKHLNDPEELRDAMLWLVDKVKARNRSISKQNTLATLEEILLEAHWGPSVEIPVSVTDINDFRQFILAGQPFHDMSFEGRSHGAETHFFTMAWMVHLKAKYKLKLDLKKFMRSLGQDERLIAWDCLFDDKSIAPGQFTTPGVLTPILNQVFGLD